MPSSLSMQFTVRKLYCPIHKGSFIFIPSFWLDRRIFYFVVIFKCTKNKTENFLRSFDFNSDFSSLATSLSNWKIQSKIAFKLVRFIDFRCSLNYTNGMNGNLVWIDIWIEFGYFSFNSLQHYFIYHCWKRDIKIGMQS